MVFIQNRDFPRCFREITFGLSRNMLFFAPEFLNSMHIKKYILMALVRSDDRRAGFGPELSQQPLLQP